MFKALFPSGSPPQPWSWLLIWISAVTSYRLPTPSTRFWFFSSLLRVVFHNYHVSFLWKAVEWQPLFIRIQTCYLARMQGLWWSNITYLAGPTSHQPVTTTLGLPIPATWFCHTSMPSMSCFNEISFPSNLVSKTRLLQKDTLYSSVDSISLLRAPTASGHTCL